MAHGTIAFGVETSEIWFMKNVKGIVWFTCYVETSGVDVSADIMVIR